MLSVHLIGKLRKNKISLEGPKQFLRVIKAGQDLKNLHSPKQFIAHTQKTYCIERVLN